MSKQNSTLEVIKNPSIADKALVDKRLGICAGCEHKKTMLKAVDVCGKCNCPLMARTFFVKSTCVMGKW